MNTDITKCLGTDCPWKEKCVRYTTPADEHYQAYFSTPPGKKIEEVFTCDMFWGEQQEGVLKQLKDIVNGK
jgi:hypothetical protein